ncbi:sigma-70 family RNA polymerase sigma factor [Streptomyces spirodelae]|uniref:Sigma-70 family RNA polymerase sigma factor n=1 Tax=Streptomyces spirodelae TaxID=2812904 RepID=A0ABS3WSD6_9ACTN|nr:sigma-70 family RNA polymerase sigma factor [Streptomyces spirodelae]MBO8186035.1 sigma-70 family RNA polymerase sigma factor [Streptomyces spirodelae]
MDELTGLAERFEAGRGPMLAVAYRMLGSLSEAEDAVQEVWLRLSRTDAESIDNLPAWLRTVVSRVCLDMLRARAARPEEPVGERMPEAAGAAEEGGGPEDEALLADSVGRALLVVLDTLGPAERVAFVLHDLFAVPFEQIAPLVGRSPGAAKKLASRARQRVRGTPAVPPAELGEQRTVVEAFLSAARSGHLAGLLAVLAPDVVRRSDPAALPASSAALLRGADAVARGTALLAHRSRYAQTALVDGAVGAVLAPRGRLLAALTFTVGGGRISAYEVIADPARLAGLELALLDPVAPVAAPGSGSQRPGSQQLA